MADSKHNPFESSTCSIAEAILWVAYRDVARIRDEPSLFSLQQWPDAVTKGHWLLLRELARERRTIDSFSSSPGRLIGPNDYRHAWSTLRAAEALIGPTVPSRQIGGLEGMKVVRSVVTFRNFIKTVEERLGFIDIDTASRKPFPSRISAPRLRSLSPSRRAIVRKLRRLNPSGAARAQTNAETALQGEEAADPDRPGFEETQTGEVAEERRRARPCAREERAVAGKGRALNPLCCP
jgi:hypothetical protein